MGLPSRIFIALFLLTAGPYYWYLIDARTAEAPTPRIDIAALRRAADRIPGPRPVEIAYAPVAVRRMAGTMLVAGGGLRSQLVGKVAYRLVTPGGDTVIDAGPNRAQAEEIGFGHFNDAARHQVDGWMMRSRRIVFTHEHPDFVGGFTTSALFDQIAPKVVVTRVQVETMDRMRPGVKAQVAPVVDAQGPTPIAPGVVFVPTPGHSRGSQMIYVRLADGREYLFAGDTAAMQRNVTWQRPRSRLASAWQGGEDRAAVVGWLKALAALHTQAPGLTVVYGSDLTWLESRRGPHFRSAFRYGSGERRGVLSDGDVVSDSDANN
ncbi:MAG: MBL fold metallo-hydrolase [Proteobacteria bacterium]|nr:MBL fold metallo-hydrolase [Pseudomonadota bacterium]